MSNLADRHLLFGLIALRIGLIRSDQLLAAFRAWRADGDRSLGDHLIARGSLDEARRDAIETLVEAAGGEVAASLGAIPVDAATLAELSSLADADSDATLAPTGAGPVDPDATRSLRDDSPTEPADGRPPVGGAATGGGLRFRVIRPHAEGGLGAVYVALDSELNREVALKRILEAHADDPASRARFLIEAEITGGLEHPGIVPVYGLGRYDDGRPFYAMRLIRGESLAVAIAAFREGEASAAGRSLEFRRLLKNFTDVCNAVEYAHSRGVLHRDLKPANVIVGDHGETLVVDWGLAKALGTAAADAAERGLVPASGGAASATLPGRAMGTPAYMSPEQARGDLEALGPRSDVYSLGATLHHLLTGEPPFQGTLREVLKAVETGDFRPPRAVDPSIDPALDAIVLKAMATDPEARYASSKSLADDVERWLADERVEAYPEPRTRTLVRWLTRHRAGVAGAAAAGLAAVIGLGVVLAVQARAGRALDAKNAELTAANASLAGSNRRLDLQRKRAEENESQAIDAVKRFKDAIVENPELKDDPKLESLRKALLKEPLAFLGRLRERLQAEDDVRPESLARLADVALSHAWLIHEIGDRPDAVRTARSAVDVFDRLVRGNPTVVAHRDGLARSQDALAFMLRELARHDEALAACRRAVEIHEGLVRDHPDVVGFRDALAWGLNMLGIQLGAMGRTDEAGDAFERAVEILERLDRDHPGAADRQRMLAKCLGSLADRHCVAWRFDEALRAFERAGEILERLDRDHPGDVGFQTDLAWGWAARGSVLKRAARPDEALTATGRAVESYERLARDHPAVTLFQTNLRSTLDDLGHGLLEAGRIDEAEAAMARAVEIGERLARDRPDDPSHAIWLCDAFTDRGLRLRESGRKDEARKFMERAVAIGERLAGDRPDDPSIAGRLGGFLNNLALTDLEASRFADARDRLLKAVDLQKQALAADPANPAYPRVLQACLVGLLRAERELGRLDEAARIERELGELRIPAPKFDEAVDARLKAVADGDAPKDAAERLLLGDRAYLTGRFPVAVRLMGEALDADPALAEDRRAQFRFNAACAASLAAAGVGNDPPADDAGKARLRGLALAWLKAEKDAWSKLLESGRPEDRPVVARALHRWEGASDLAVVRAPEPLAKLPESERAAWKALWDDVAELIRKAE